ncbi:MAG: hypothetical protein LBT44_06490 [Clostridiales bacterium]|nr:hypothetical protein [Clostridiales bacterium]
MAKEKIILAIVAGVLSMTLGVGGMLMFITAQSTTATSSLAFGTIQARLQHKDGTVPGNGYSWVLPNQILMEGLQVARIENEKNISAYIAVFAELKLDGQSVTDDKIKKLITSGVTEEAMLGMLQSILAQGLSKDAEPEDVRLTADEWLFIPIGDDTFDINPPDLKRASGTSGLFFYIDKTDPTFDPTQYPAHLGDIKRLPKLKVFEKSEDKTELIFDSIRVPVLSGKEAEAFALIRNHKINVELTAYLVQSEYNQYYLGNDITFTDYIGAFTAAQNFKINVSTAP